MKEEREQNANDKLMRIPAAAEVLDISVRQLWRLITMNELPRPVKIGRSSKLFVSDIDTYMDRLKAKRKK